MKIHFIFLTLLFLVAYNVQAITINEFMPDPDDGCGDCSEWIEITSYVNSFLENITVDTGEYPITLNGSIQANEFIIITKNSSAFSEIWNSEVTIFENKKMSIRNKGDNITIYNGSEILQKVEYKSSENNRSYGLCDSIFVPQNTSTPGFPNICDSKDTNETKENQTTTNNTCDLYVWIKCNETFGMGSNKYYPMVEDLEGGDFEPEVEYWIKDLFGNIVRSRFRTNNTNTAKSWTPPEITGTEAYVIHVVITNEVCNDTNLSNNAAEKLIIVKGDKPYSERECSCEPEIIEVEKSCSCKSIPEKEVSEKKEFEILSCPSEIEKDDEIEIKISMKNPSHDRKNYTVYSYVYEGNKPLSLGFDGNEWVNTWNANKQNVSISRNSSFTLTLINRIANDTEPGQYKLRVRIWLDDKKHDITRDILIKEPEELEPVNQTTEKENKTKYNESEGNESESKINIPTAQIVSKSEGNWFSTFIESIINFFKNLFNL